MTKLIWCHKSRQVSLPAFYVRLTHTKQALDFACLSEVIRFIPTHHAHSLAERHRHIKPDTGRPRKLSRIVYHQIFFCYVRAELGLPPREYQGLPNFSDQFWLWPAKTNKKKVIVMWEVKSSRASAGNNQSFFFFETKPFHSIHEDTTIWSKLKHSIY